MAPHHPHCAHSNLEEQLAELITHCTAGKQLVSCTRAVAIRLSVAVGVCVWGARIVPCRADLELGAGCGRVADVWHGYCDCTGPAADLQARVVRWGPAVWLGHPRCWS